MKIPAGYFILGRDRTFCPFSTESKASEAAVDMAKRENRIVYVYSYSTVGIVMETKCFSYHPELDNGS